MASAGTAAEGGAKTGGSVPVKHERSEGGGALAAVDLLANIAHSNPKPPPAAAATQQVAAAPPPTKRQRTAAAQADPKKVTRPADAKDKYPCPYEGCAYVANHRRYITEHMRTHTGCKPYTCAWPGCGYASSGSGHLSA